LDWNRANNCIDQIDWQVEKGVKLGKDEWYQISLKPRKEQMD